MLWCKHIPFPLSPSVSDCVAYTLCVRVCAVHWLWSNGSGHVDDHLDDLLCARGLSPAPQRTARIAQLLVDDITTQRPTFGLEHTGRVGEMYRQVLPTPAFNSILC